MVNWPGNSSAWFDSLLLAEEKAQTLLTRLDPQRRAKVLAALAGLIILGFGLVALAWLGGRFTRWYMNQGDDRKGKDDQEDWASSPIVKMEKPKRSKKSDDS